MAHLIASRPTRPEDPVEPEATLPLKQPEDMLPEVKSKFGGRNQQLRRIERGQEETSTA